MSKKKINNIEIVNRRINIISREYLDINYQIHHDKTHSLYFRGCELIGIDKIDDFKYAPPYLFSTYDNNIVIFDVEGKVSSEIIYEVK